MGVLALVLAASLSAGAFAGVGIGERGPQEPGAGAVVSGAWLALDALPSRGELLSALAEAGHAGLAVGDAGGVAWWRAGEWARAQTPAAVRDLAFGRDGRLWIGTQDGLFVWPRDGRPQRRPLRDGDASGRVARIEAEGEVLVVTTESGAYWSASGAVFQTLGGGSTEQWVGPVAVRRGVAQAGHAGRPDASGSAVRLSEVWTFGGAGLIRTRGVEASAGLRVVDRVVWPLPRPGAELDVVDLVFDPGDAQLLLVYREAIAVLEVDAGAAPEARWRWIRPVLPPGAGIRRLVFGSAGRVWLATDHGLLVADGLDGQFARARHPAGSRECTDLVEADVLPGDARAVALCRTSLLALSHEAPGSAVDQVLEPAPAAAGGEGSAGAAAESAPIALPVDPPVAEIRARALARVGLSVERADTLWRGLRQKAYWPSLELRGAYDADRDRGLSRDQTFVSGDTRDLLDRERGEGHHYAAAVVVDWELGEIAYPEDSVDLYRELRQVTSLRDDVADEIHQLYFERQRIRARLARREPLAEGEVAELVLRAEELDSGLDAWTGGWLSAWRADREAGAPSLHPGRSDRAID